MENTAYLLSVGNEVLSGRVINTNASFLAMELEKIGITVVKVLTVADDSASIDACLDEFMASSSKILITTGGLGPTHDDFTKEEIAKYCKVELVENKEAKDDMFNYFGEERTDSNYKQVYQPSGSIIVHNKLGTADGFILEHNDKVIISLVGPSYEMQPMYINGVKPYLLKYGKELIIKEYTVVGRSESSLENDLKELVASCINVNVAPYCGNGKIRYQLTASSEYIDEFNSVKEKFEQIVGNNIVSKNNEPIEEVVVKLLKEKGLKISFAESMTGGLLAEMITSISGASNVLDQSFVTYAASAKNKYLGVSLDTINKFDVVSKPVVMEMVNGLEKLSNSNVCVAVSGYAGPDGAEVGKVCYAIKYNKQISVFEKHFKGNRNMIRERAARDILFNVYCVLNK
ncbi:MAG: CinA family nicotinamide mononucleotide deamidase-related protein [Bacilli bacterium]|nr:CinA family nicotinamide mononucleotide deamidase-related protein [Bacilli bacterium]